MIESLARRWNAFWYGPVAVVRPYLLVRCFMLLLAFDAWLLLAYRSAAYGFDGFNVAHFAWLDAVQPTPSPAIYGCVQFLIGLLALYVAVTGFNRLVIAAVTFLYSYGWSMSLLDGYQHHYLTSIVLFCMACFPSARQWFEISPRGSNRNLKFDAACGYRMLGVTVAIVYIYTAMAKCDARWLAGETLQTIDQSSGLLSSIASIGGTEIAFWRLLSASVIVFELLIATGYIVASLQDTPMNRWLKRSLIVPFGLAIALHVGFEFLQLRIGLFSYYMIATACVYFLPTTALARFASIVDVPLNWVENGIQSLLTRFESRLLAAAVVVASLAALVICVCGYSVKMPGSFAACVVVAVGLAVWAIVCVVRSSTESVFRPALILAGTAMVMWVAIANNDARYQFHMQLANQYLELGQPSNAVAAYENAERHLSGDNQQRRDWLLNIDAALQANGDVAASVERLREAIELDPNSAEAHYNLGMVLLRQGKLNEAADELDEALRLNPGFVEAMVNLANVATVRGDVQSAIEHLNTALKIKPHYAEAHYNLGNVYLQNRQFDKAKTSYRDALSRDPTLAAAHNNMGNAMLQQGELAEAEASVARALGIDPTLPSAHCSLGNICFKQGQVAEAAEHYQTALRHDPNYAEAKHNLRIARAQLQRRFQ
jgi:tetratricopeptide (TPR) repeat protein